MPKKTCKYLVSATLFADNTNSSFHTTHQHQKSVNNHYSPHLFAKNSVAKSISSLQEMHAPPLAPLNTRDLKALDELFERNDNEMIEADIISKLKMMVPEPSWEEDPYDFLREFL